MFFHWSMILAIPPMLLAFYAQYKVKSNFKKYSQVTASRGYSGAQVARSLLDANRLQDVPVELSHGSLSDHYDPRSRAVRLSPEVYHGTSVASLGVAAHEVGHAIQHDLEYLPLTLRHNIFPIVNFGSMLAMPLFLFGMLFKSAGLIGIGIIAFSFAVLFQLITLPVEFNASSRAMGLLTDMGYVERGSEESATRKVLNAAALTYVAATLVALMELVQYIIIFLENREE